MDEHLHPTLPELRPCDIQNRVQETKTLVALCDGVDGPPEMGLLKPGCRSFGLWLALEEEALLELSTHPALRKASSSHLIHLFAGFGPRLLHGFSQQGRVLRAA